MDEPEEIPALKDQKTLLAMVARFILICFLISGILAVMNLLYGNFQLSDVTSYVLEGIGIVLFGWGEDRLWRSTLSRTRKSSSSIVGLITRIPLWFIAGGMGYETGLLIAKSVGLLQIYEIPVKPFFVFGGNIGIVIMGIWHFRRYRAERIVIETVSVLESVSSY